MTYPKRHGMRRAVIPWLLKSTAAGAFAMDRHSTIELRGVAAGDGKVYVALYDSEPAYKNDEPFKGFVLDATSATIRIDVSLPEGLYVVSAFQDVNGNGKLDLGIFGIPKEPIWLSGYDGKGIPGGFEKLKFRIDRDDQAIIVNKVAF